MKKFDSETDFSSDSGESANGMPFVGDILQPFQCDLVFRAAEILAKKTLLVLDYSLWLAPTSHNLMHSQLTRWH